MPESQEFVKALINGKEISARIGAPIGQYLGAEFPCGGIGKCGKCRIIADGEVSPLTDTERALLTDSDIASGVRLACSAKISGSCRVKTLFNTGDIANKASHNKDFIVTEGIFKAHAIKPAFQEYGVAIDIGTTTVAARLYSGDGTLLATSCEINPQVALGADVISRICAALDGELDKLTRAIVGCIDEIIADMCARAGVNCGSIDGMVITGNTAMLHLLTSTMPRGIATAPFIPDRSFGEALKAEQIGLNSVTADTEVYLPPCIAAFVGADAACAILATELCRDGQTRLLVDVGTNGEICLNHNGRLYVASAAAGPAFEGVGITHGMRATDGAICESRVTDGALVTRVVGGGKALGICGSGLIDIAASLLELGMIDESGAMKHGSAEISDGVRLTPQDVRMLQMAKGAICAAIQTVLDSAGIKAPVDTLLAGGFGKFINVENAKKIGMLPRSAVGSVTAIGNAALDGATVLLLDTGARAGLLKLTAAAQTVDLASSQSFFEHYIDSMAF